MIETTLSVRMITSRFDSIRRNLVQTKKERKKEKKTLKHIEE